jgi:hypothetical protein
MGKNWHFIFSSVDKLSRYSNETKKKTQIKLLSNKINKNTTEKSKYYRVALSR